MKTPVRKAPRDAAPKKTAHRERNKIVAELQEAICMARREGPQDQMRWVNAAPDAAHGSDKSRPEGYLTSRTRALVDGSHEIEQRLQAMLRSLRTPPPEPLNVGARPAQGQMSLEERISTHEASQKAIADMLTDMEMFI